LLGVTIANYGGCRSSSQLRENHLVEVGATEEVAAGAADELAAAVFEARGAGGTEAGVVLGGDGALGGWGFWGGFGFGDLLHGERLAQIGRISTPFGDGSAPK
jgi:hypothetical protein